MRPAIIACIATLLPLGAYTHRNVTPPVHDLPASRAESLLFADNSGAKKSTAAATPDLPSDKPPLCASPAVAAWNPAATGDGRICAPTQWAGAKPGPG